MGTMIGISLAELSRRLGRNKSTLLRHANAGTIPRHADKTFDEGAVRKALAEKLDPARAKPLKLTAGGESASLRDVAATPPRPVTTIEDAQEAVALIRRILAEEGRVIEGAPTFRRRAHRRDDPEGTGAGV